MRDNCTEPRDLAMINLASAGMRVGEMVVLIETILILTAKDVSCSAKKSKERAVLFDARAKCSAKPNSSRTDKCIKEAAVCVVQITARKAENLGGVGFTP